MFMWQARAIPIRYGLYNKNYFLTDAEWNMYYSSEQVLNDEKVSPGAKMESPPLKPIISLIFSITTVSIKMKTGAIS